MFSERTEESSAVQYFQVGACRPSPAAVLVASGRLCSRGQGPRAPVLALPLTSHITLGRFLRLLGLSFLICETDARTHLGGLLEGVECR